MKRLLIIAMLTCTWLNSCAQSIGVRGGVGYSTLSGGKISGSEIKGRGGFYAGAFAELPILGVLAVQPEVSYSEQGARWSLDEGGKTNSVQLKTSYINVPLLAKVRIGNMALLVGPQLGILTGTPAHELSLSGTTVKLSRDTFAAFDFSLGAGLEFTVAKGLFLDLRYTHGLVNVLDKNNSSLRKLNISEKNNFRSSMLTLGLGIKL